MDNNFKDIEGFENRYQINKNGVIINAKTGYQLKPYKDKYSYLHFVNRDNKGIAHNIFIYKLVNNTFNMNITNDEILEYYQKNVFNKSTRNKFGPKQRPVKLLFKNGTTKIFNSLMDASEYIGKNSNYLSTYINKNKNDKFIIIRNYKFICHLTFINVKDLNNIDENNINEEDFNVDDNFNESEEDNNNLPDNFKEIPGYEKNYAINKNGEVICLKDNLIADIYITNGEKHINLFKHGKNKTFRIADLVGYTFIQNNSNYKFINKDGDVNNNNVNNLVMEKIILDNSRAKKKNKLILKDGTVKYFDTLISASRFLGKSAGYLSFYLANHKTHDIVTAEKGFIGRIEFKK